MWKAKIIGIDKKHRTRTSPAGRKEPQLKFHEHNNFGSRKAKDHCRKGPLYLVQNKWLGSYFEHSKCWVLIRSTSKPISRWAYCITSYYYAILTFRVATTRPLAQFYCRQGVTNLNQRQVKIRAKPTNIFVAISFKVLVNWKNTRGSSISKDQKWKCALPWHRVLSHVTVMFDRFFLQEMCILPYPMIVGIDKSSVGGI